jgi:tRNA(Ile2) C34 agmatinyltransferase TiaS
MGLITIACPSCKALTEWFTGNPDQRCHRCKYEAQQSPLSIEEWRAAALALMLVWGALAVLY